MGHGVKGPRFNTFGDPRINQLAGPSDQLGGRPTTEGHEQDPLGRCPRPGAGRLRGLTRVRVLPVPAPAMMRSGPPSWSTALSCSAFSPRAHLGADSSDVTTAPGYPDYEHLFVVFESHGPSPWEVWSGPVS